MRFFIKYIMHVLINFLASSLNVFRHVTVKNVKVKNNADKFKTSHYLLTKE